MSFHTSAAHESKLDRREVIPLIVGEHSDFLFVTSLAGANYDVASLSGYGGNAFISGGAMGAATMMGLGLALAQPQRRTMVATGDGDLLMSIGSLATIAIAAPSNLSILCIDNGHYGETGYQNSHTSFGVDLAGVAAAAGISKVMTVREMDDVEPARLLLREEGPIFVVVKVNATNAPSVRLNLHPASARERFRSHLMQREVGLPVSDR